MDKSFKAKRIQFACDNIAVVHLLNSKTDLAECVMSLVKAIVKCSLCHDFHSNAVHVTSDNSGIADSISRKQWQIFKLLAPEADQQPNMNVISIEF